MDTIKTYNVIVRIEDGRCVEAVELLQGEVEVQVNAKDEGEAEKLAYEALRGACIDAETIEEEEDWDGGVDDYEINGGSK